MNTQPGLKLKLKGRGRLAVVHSYQSVCTFKYGRFACCIITLQLSMKLPMLCVETLCSKSTDQQVKSNEVHRWDCPLKLVTETLASKESPFSLFLVVVSVLFLTSFHIAHRLVAKGNQVMEFTKVSHVILLRQIFCTPHAWQHERVLSKKGEKKTQVQATQGAGTPKQMPSRRWNHET